MTERGLEFVEREHAVLVRVELIEMYCCEAIGIGAAHGRLFHGVCQAEERQEIDVTDK